MAALLYGFLPLMAGMIMASLGAYTIARNPHLRSAQVFFLSSVVAALLGISNSAMMISDGPTEAMLWGRATLFFAVMFFGSLWYLSSSLLPRPSLLPGRPLLFWPSLIALATAAGLSVEGVRLVEVGWMLEWSLGTLLAFLSSLLLATGAALCALYARNRSTDPSFREECVLLAFGSLFPFVYMAAMIPLRLMMEGFTPLTALPYLVTGGVYTYMVLGRRTFSLAPLTETGGTVKRLSVPLSPSTATLVEDKDTGRAFRMFAAELERGIPGLLVCRTHPDQVRERYGVRCSVLWLSSQPGADRVEPSALNLLQHNISDFIEKNRGAVVMLEGLEYLISENNVVKVLRTVYIIKDGVTMSGAKLIVSLDPAILGMKDLALVEREFITSDAPGNELSNIK
mgnify:CR=1 FL=1